MKFELVMLLGFFIPTLMPIFHSIRAKAAARNFPYPMARRVR